MKKNDQPEYSYGFGTVVELKDKFRRKPFVAKIYDKTLKRQRSIGTAATREDAVALLLGKRNNPALYNPTGLTFADVYAIARREYISHLDGKTQDSYQTAYNHCTKLHNRAFADITTFDLQSIVSDVRDKGDGQPTQKKIKTVLRHMYKSAVKYGVIEAKDNITPYMELDPYKPVKQKVVFNTRQINRLRKSTNPWAWTVIMLIYNGCRISELLHLKKADVKLGQRYFKIHKAKTDKGIRAIPIHKDVVQYYEYFIQHTPGSYLIADDNGKPLSYSRYRTRWNKALKQCNVAYHTPHEARHTLATITKRKGMDGFYRTQILGHVDEKLTNEVYTHAEIRDLRREMDKI